MVEKFKSFLLQRIYSQITTVILKLEGLVEYHPNFIEKLKNISTKSTVAKHLLDILGKEFEDNELKQNYIKPSGLEDKITFLSQKKYLDAKNRGSIMSPYDLKTNETGVGRLRDLFKLTGQNFSSEEIEKFVNLYKSLNLSEHEKFELVGGDQISFWYSETNYSKGGGTLNKSCMMDVDSDFFQIYTDSPNCRMLILTTNITGEKKLLGRALVWKVSRCFPKITDTDLYFMDRIYTVFDSDVNKFKKWSDEKGWLRKYYNDSDEETGMQFSFSNKSISCKINVDLEIPGSYLISNYPYLDTLKFMDQSKTELSNIGYESGFLLDSTEGSIGVCSYCDGSGYGTCPTCRDRGVTTCHTCDGRGERTCIMCEGSGKNPQECVDCEGRGLGDVDCPECGGTGTRITKKLNQKECKYCSGNGKDFCETCKGSGITSTECDNCDGDGSVQCSTCDGDGEIDCPTCQKSRAERNLCPYCTGLIKLL